MVKPDFMQSTPARLGQGHANLRQHFHNYFELLLGAERSKLQRAIGEVEAPVDQQDILIEIECRINYLRGAVRMGKLLCLIDQEEARTNLSVLSVERECLRASVLGKQRVGSHATVRNERATRIKAIRESLQPAVQS